MIPMKHSTIFKNRWFALLWAAGIIWFALQVAGPPDGPGDGNGAATTDATGAPVEADQARQLERAIADM